MGQDSDGWPGTHTLARPAFAPQGGASRRQAKRYSAQARRCGEKRIPSEENNEEGG
jgi:hypothetical protein